MKITQIITAKDTEHRLTQMDAVLMVEGSGNKKDYISVDTSLRYQEILGFGGAFTESAAYTLSKMTPDKRDEVIHAYYDPKDGIGYTIGRIHMNSCDFSLENYTYIKEGDQLLETFDVSREEKWVFPLIKDAEKIAGPIKLLVSPWSPPAFMKTNGEMNRGGQLLPQYADAWARYYAKFILECRQRDLTIWGLSVQNEPAAVQSWDSCIYSAEEERDFVKNHLGPVMQAGSLKDVNILIWDHNRDIILERTVPVFSDPEAAKYIWGTAIHWYVSEAFENVGKVHELFPDKHLLFTEGCQEGGVHLGSWKTGERYGRNIMGDLNNFVEGYLDWNIVLDEMGGPNHVGNLCDAPIIADTQKDLINYQSSYYYIGHFSKFIRPGARRVAVEMDLDHLLATAFVNVDESLILVLQNETDQLKKFEVRVKGLHTMSTIAPHAIATYIIH